MFYSIIFIVVLCLGLGAINATQYMMCDISSDGYVQLDAQFDSKHSNNSVTWINLHYDSKELNTTETIKLELHVGEFVAIKEKVCQASWFAYFTSKDSDEFSFFLFSDAMNLLLNDDILAELKFEHENKRKQSSKKDSKQVSKHVNDFRNSNSQIYSNQDMFLKNTEVDKELAFDGDDDVEDDEDVIEL
jgi:hypothetical protein